MTKVSLRKLSVLGLVLMGASAVTAAILPKSNTRVFSNGHIQNDSTRAGAAQATCVEGAGAVKCDYTATAGSESSTTSSKPGTSNDGHNSTGTVNTGTHAIGSPSAPTLVSA